MLPEQKLQLCNELLAALESASHSDSKAKAFTESYSHLFPSLNSDPSLTEVVALAKRLTNRWNQRDSTNLHNLASGVKKELERKKAARKHVREEEVEPKVEAVKSYKSDRTWQLPSFKDVSRSGLKALQWGTAAAAAGMTALKVVSFSGKLWSGDYGGAVSELIDHRFYTIVAPLTTVSKVASLARSHLPDDASRVLGTLYRDLTAEAREGKLYPAIGRETEIHLTIEKLNAADKPNVVLVGPPGVGKTAIVEGLAQLIAKGDVPGFLRNKRILSLNMGSLISGTQYRGTFEKKLLEVIEQAKDPNVILFIDEVHVVIGAGAAEGSPGAADLFKPHLDRGLIRCIGATTQGEYLKLLKDPAFERRFKLVEIHEPSIEHAAAIVRARKEKLEQHYGVFIREEAILAAVTYSHKYIKDKFLPDKAIDILNDVASRISMALNSDPLKVQLLIAKLTDQSKELSNLRAEGGFANQKRKQELERSIASNQEDLSNLISQCERDREIIKEIVHMRKELALLYPQIERYKEQCNALEAKIQEVRSQLHFLKDNVDQSAIIAAIEEKTGVKIRK